MFDSLADKLTNAITNAIAAQAERMMSSWVGMLLVLLAIGLVVFPMARSIYRFSKWAAAGLGILLVAMIVFRPAMPKPSAEVVQQSTSYEKSQSQRATSSPPTTPGPPPTIFSKGDWVSFTCVQCNKVCAGDSYFEGAFVDLTCGACGRPTPVAQSHLYLVTAAERAERLELAKHGILPPDGLKFGEWNPYEAFRKNRSASMGPSLGGNLIPDGPTRERWNNYQHSLPASSPKHFLGRYGDYTAIYVPPSEQEKAEAAMASEVRVHRMELAKVGLAANLTGPEDPTEAAAINEFKGTFDGLATADPRYPVMRNQQIVAINRWNLFQRSVPEDRRHFLDDYGRGIDGEPIQYKLKPVNKEEELDEKVASLRGFLALCGIMFPDATHQEKKMLEYIRKPENAESAASFRRDRKNYIDPWNIYQKELEPTKRTYYLTRDGELTKQKPGK